MIDSECDYCEREYWAERSSSKYCSDSCRTMAYRQRKKNEEIKKSTDELVKKALEEHKIIMDQKWAEFYHVKERDDAARKEEDSRRLIEARATAEAKALKKKELDNQKEQKRKLEEAKQAAIKSQNEHLISSGIKALETFFSNIANSNFNPPAEKAK